MAEFNIDISKLPEDVRDKLAELDLELSEGKLHSHWFDEIIIVNNEVHVFLINNLSSLLCTELIFEHSA
jgi:hypothetical protein